MVWIANIYMSLFGLLRQNLKAEKIEAKIKNIEYNDLKIKIKCTTGKNIRIYGRKFQNLYWFWKLQTSRRVCPKTNGELTEIVYHDGKIEPEFSDKAKLVEKKMPFNVELSKDYTVLF